MWPDAVTYREAIQQPLQAFHDRALAEGQVRLDRLGLPVAYTGRFAVVFRLTDREGIHWALRCFTTPERPGDVPRALRYALIDRHLERLPDAFVEFVFHERGIRVGGEWFPAIALAWSEGATLGNWTEANLACSERLKTLAATLDTLRLLLEDAGIAHGDWQHDNLLISNDGSRATLVDYDGVFVPELAGTHAPERGHPNYQHPARRARHFGVGLDRFACLAIRVALLALAVDPALWERFGDSDRLLFGKSDLENPEQSPLFTALETLTPKDTPLDEALSALRQSLADGEATALLPPISSGATAPLAALAARREASEEAWWEIADRDAPWWRQKVSSRRAPVDPAWAARLSEIVRSIDAKPDFFARYRLQRRLAELDALLARERKGVRHRLERLAQARRSGDAALAVGSLYEFLLVRLVARPTPYDFPSRLSQAKLTNALAIDRNRDLLPRFLRVAECKRVLHWLDEVVAEETAAYEILCHPDALEKERATLDECDESLEGVARRLAGLRERLERKW